MYRKNIQIILTLLLAMAFLGCASTTELDRNWGRSFVVAKHRQILNPEAGKNLEPVAGLSGPAEEKVLERYITGGKSPKPSFSEITIKP